MEDFFSRDEPFRKGIPKDQETALKQLWLDHGMEVLGPPLKF